MNISLQINILNEEKTVTILNDTDIKSVLNDFKKFTEVIDRSEAKYRVSVMVQNAKGWFTYQTKYIKELIPGCSPIETQCIHKDWSLLLPLLSTHLKLKNNL